MLIHVNYTDNRFDYVKDNMLHSLIETRKIAKFRRSTGWVRVGIDPVRQFQRSVAPKPAGEEKKIIHVAYKDSRFDYVSDRTLDALIESWQIVRFKRVSGWVTLGVDQLRKGKREYTYRYPNELKKHIQPAMVSGRN